LLVAAVGIALTLVFTAQDAIRGGVRAGLGRTLAMNALDWVAWSAWLPLILFVGRRHRLDDAAHRWRSALVWLALAVVCCAGAAVITGLAMRATHMVPDLPIPRPLPAFLLAWMGMTAGFNALIFAMLAGLLHAVQYYDDLRTRQSREAELEARVARAELNVLRTQLQPHFFFNALHTVSSLMMTDVAAAQQVIASLGELVRASIDHTAEQEVLLRAELGFVQRYLDIQRARFRTRLAVHVDVADALLDAAVPSLILQPLVENAIRHGVERSPTGGAIWIHAARHDGRLRLEVRNTGDRDDATDVRPTASTRIGLMNLEARIAQLYGAAGRFDARRETDGGFAVTLELPYRRLDAHATGAVA
jgi:anti-sigma regulatory factor (Ser/Thr protein kinase)